MLDLTPFGIAGVWVGEIQSELTFFGMVLACVVVAGSKINTSRAPFVKSKCLEVFQGNSDLPVKSIHVSSTEHNTSISIILGSRLGLVGIGVRIDQFFKRSSNV